MSHSHTLWKQAQTVIPGGVNSPVRAFRSVGGDPIFIKKGLGARITAETDQTYIDYVGSWGALIVGHAHPYVVKAVQAAAENGLSFGAPTTAEVVMAEKICSLMPAIEMVRLVNSGTEATLSAIRLARGFTGRNKILKFIGCYHGHCDPLLVKAGSGVLDLCLADSAGIPAATVQDTLVAHYNDLAHVEKIFAKHGKEIAAIIVEPIAGNMNCILPQPNFLNGLRKICDHYSSLLIFDEVMTGFRVGLHGAQGRFNIKPDLTTLGKIIGGGTPIGAFGGRKEIMEYLAPLGAVYQAGTLSGNPLAMAAGLATLHLISQPGFYENLELTTQTLINGLKERAIAAHIEMQFNACGGMFGLFFTSAPEIINYQLALSSDKELFNRFFHGMLREGIYFAPSAFEAGFVSSAHQHTEITSTLNAAEIVFASLHNKETP